MRVIPELERQRERSVEREATPAQAARTRRDPFFDNAKFLLIVLVVVGHAIWPAMDRTEMYALYQFIAAFHMPAFVFIAGYFSRDIELSPGRVHRLLTGILAPYVIFQVAYQLAGWLQGEDVTFSLTQPYWIMWFLMALFVWRMLTPLLKWLRWPVAIAFVVSLAAPLLPEDMTRTLSLDRVLGMLFFFVAGWAVRPEHLERLRRPVPRAIAGVGLAGGAVLMYALADRMPLRWFWWADSYDAFGLGVVQGTGLGLLTIGWTLALMTAFFAVVPARRTWFSGLGARSMYAYLLHGFAMPLTSVAFGLLPAGAGEVVLTVSAAVLAVVLMTRPVRTLTRWAVEPRLDPVLRPGRSPQMGEPSTR